MTNRWPRVALATGVLAGVLNTVVFALANPGQVAFASDVYYHAARAVLHGGDLYHAWTGPAFKYPPVVALAFTPHAALGSPTLAYALQTALNLATLALFAVLLAYAAERGGASLSRRDHLLVAGYAFASTSAGYNLVMAQVNPQIALLVAAGAMLLAERRRAWSGVAFGLAALVKLFPALVGVWLLRRRAWRAIAAATATGVALLAAGVVVFGPDASVTYVTDVLRGEMAVASFPHGPDPTAAYVTVRRQLTYLAPGIPAGWLLPAGALVLAPVFAGVNRSVATFEDRLVALQGTLLATLVLFPLEPFYVLLAVFPMVSLLYVLDPGLPRALFLAGAVVVSIPITYESVRVVTATLHVPHAARALVLDAARAAFSFALPSTVGVWLLLAGCLLHQHRAARADT